MFTDMVGWSALAQREERLALTLLEEHRTILRPIFTRFGGREVKTVGDGFLVEFDSALAATESGIEIQKSLVQRNSRSEPPAIELRIGIHVGDVLHREGDLLGDAVNIASRIEPLAEAGGICLTGPVADQVTNKIPYRLLPLEHAFLKNIDTPILVYEVDLPWHAPPAARVTPWTDRTTELGLLRRLLGAVTQGEGQVIAIGGDSGIGKSRLAEEVFRRAGPTAFRVLRARGFQGVGDVPYSVWAETCLEYVREIPDLLLYKVCANCSVEVAQIVPQLAQRLGTVPVHPTSAPVPSQLTLFAGMVQFFQNVAREGPLAIVIDDLQWADPGSLRLLEYLAHHLQGHRIAILLTYRDTDLAEGDLLADLLSELRRSRLVTSLSLKRFDSEDGSRLASAILGATDLPREVTEPILEKAGGNPFFVEELLRSLVEEGDLVRTSDGWRRRSATEIEIPASVRDVVLRRVRRAGDETIEVLAIASVVGSTFRFDWLRRVSGLESERLLLLLERALRARLLREREPSPGEVVYEFVDEQIRDVLYAGLSKIRRQRYHLEVAHVLQGIPGGNAPEAASELARHYRLGGNLAEALRCAQTAAEFAASVYDHEGAVRSLDIALAAQPTPALRAHLLEQRGEELVALGHPEMASEAWEAAIQVFDTASDRKRAADLHRRLGYLQRQFFQRNELALRELVRAREILETEPEGPELASLFGDLADLYWYDGQISQARDMCEKALELAGRVNAHEVEGWVYLLLAALVPPAEKNRTFEYLEKMRDIGERYDLPEVFVGALHNLSVAHMQIQGNWEQAVRTLDEGIGFARKVRSVPFEMTLRTRFLPYVLVHAGQLDRAAELAQEMLAYMARYTPTPEPLDLFVLGRVAAIRGDLAGAESHLSKALEVLDTSPDWSVRLLCLGTLAWIREAQGKGEEAVPLYRQARELAQRVGESALFGQLYSSILLGLVTTGLEGTESDRSQAEARSRELSALAEAMDEDLIRAYAQHAEGRVRSHAGDLISAARALETSARLWEKVGWPVEYLRVLQDLGSAYEARGEYALALETHTRAREIASRLGASNDVHRLEGQIRDVKAKARGTA